MGEFFTTLWKAKGGGFPQSSMEAAPKGWAGHKKAEPWGTMFVGGGLEHTLSRRQAGTLRERQSQKQPAVCRWGFKCNNQDLEQQLGIGAAQATGGFLGGARTGGPLGHRQLQEGLQGQLTSGLLQ